MKFLSIFFLLFFLFSCNSNLEPDIKIDPVGKLIKVDGKYIHVNVKGNNEPTIIFLNGIDLYGSLGNWGKLQKEISTKYRTMSYDRFGYFWSEQGDNPRSTNNIVSELEKLLDIMNLFGPFIIVTHGIGRTFGQTYAGRNFNKVKGIIMIDPINHTSIKRMRELGIKKEIPNKNFRPILKFLLSTGIVKENLMQYQVPDEYFILAKKFYKKNNLAWFDESTSIECSFKESEEYNDLGSLPIVTLTSKKGKNQNYVNLWIKLQKELCSISSNTNQITLDEIGRFVHIVEPKIVSDIIYDFIKKVQ